MHFYLILIIKEDANIVTWGKFIWSTETFLDNVFNFYLGIIEVAKLEEIKAMISLFNGR